MTLCVCGCGKESTVYRGKQNQYLKGHGGAKIAQKTERYKVDEVTGCWLWLLAKRDGYGIERKKGRSVQAHRSSYEKHIGPIPIGHVLDHVVCQNRGCINPWHSEPVTSRVNTQRGPNAQINNHVALAIRLLCAKGISRLRIEAHFKLSKSLVQDVITGKTWKGDENEPALLSNIRAASQLRKVESWSYTTTYPTSYGHGENSRCGKYGRTPRDPGADSLPPPQGGTRGTDNSCIPQMESLLPSGTGNGC